MHKKAQKGTKNRRFFNRAKIGQKSPHFCSFFCKSPQKYIKIDRKSPPRLKFSIPLNKITKSTKKNQQKTTRIPTIFEKKPGSLSKMLINRSFLHQNEAHDPPNTYKISNLNLHPPAPCAPKHHKKNPPQHPQKKSKKPQKSIKTLPLFNDPDLPQ
jgi:hypothetical protein